MLLVFNDGGCNLDIFESNTRTLLGSVMKDGGSHDGVRNNSSSSQYFNAKCNTDLIQFGAGPSLSTESG